MTDYSSIRGFNYQPSYVRTGLDSWVDRFDPEIIKLEVGRGKRYFPGINTLRIWLSLDAYIINPVACIRNINTAMDVIGDYGLKMIPVIYNGWHSMPDFGGISFEQISLGTKTGVFKNYMADLIGPHANDDRVLLWDLCNEPFNNAPGELATQMVFDWVKGQYDMAKSLGAKSPVVVSSCPGINQMELLEPISDIITFHPYFAWNDWVPEERMFSEFLDECVEFSKKVGKPLLATETCWGDLDDAKRAERMRFELGELAKRGIGFTAHLMHYSQVADANRRWQPPYIAAGNMSFINEDGSLRPGHEAFNEF